MTGLLYVTTEDCHFCEHVRFIHDYPRMWIDVNQLLRQLPKVS